VSEPADRASAVKWAEEALAGKTSAILASRELVRILRRLNVADDDPDLLCLVGLDSETDSIPVGPERVEWAPDALARKAPSIREVEEWAQRFGESAFKSIVQKWGAP
jgi:hypothetical protein